jgi:ADP-ribosyl-[dinitrogen reductase] hydrolase
VVHTVPFALYCHLRHGDAALLEAVNAGGDTDTIGAIVGAWQPSPPAALVAALGDGPFGRTHLRNLARALARKEPPPRWSWPRALLRNLALMPVVLAHGFRRLIPF